MTKQVVSLYERLKRMGFTPKKQMKLYGEQLELRSDPIVTGDGSVFVEVIDKKSGRLRRVRIPLTILSMTRTERSVA